MSESMRERGRERKNRGRRERDLINPIVEDLRKTKLLPRLI